MTIMERGSRSQRISEEISKLQERSRFLSSTMVSGLDRSDPGSVLFYGNTVVTTDGSGMDPDR